MLGDQICPRCGQLIPRGEKVCPLCQSGTGWWSLQREVVLLASLVALGMLFAITSMAARAYHARQEGLGEEWFKRGEQALEGRQAEAALEDFRTALAYSPENAEYRLHLAQALVASHRLDEAEAHLLTLWHDEPGDGTVNLELAHLAVERGDVQEAQRYFHNAIYGVWPGNPDDARRQVRLELCEFLVQRGLKPQAQAELMALATRLPREADWHLRTAALFEQAGDNTHAFQEYRLASEIDRGNVTAAAGAGESAFALGDYAGALPYLERAARTVEAEAQTKPLLETTRLILALDPYEPRLPRAEANQRALQAFAIARARLEGCVKTQAVPGPDAGTTSAPTPPPELAGLVTQVQQLAPQASAANLQRNPDLRTQLMDAVSSIEEQTATLCGKPQGRDLALLLVSRKHGGRAP